MRCGATRFGRSKGCVATREKNACTRLKKTRGQGAGNTSTALTRPVPTHPEGGQAVQKPMALLYAFDGGLAVTNAIRSVTNSTVTAQVSG